VPAQHLVAAGEQVVDVLPREPARVVLVVDVAGGRADEDERPDLGQELTNSFCRTDPAIARHFAQVTFLSDNRADLARVRVPTLVLQCAQDVIAPEVVGRYVAGRIAGSTLVRLAARGHCPNLSAPEETIQAIRSFL